MTADVPRQPSTQDKDIATLRALVRAGVIGPCHRRWPELDAVARSLGCRPEDAIWRIRHGRWSTNNTALHIQTTLADVIREAATR